MNDLAADTAAEQSGPLPHAGEAAPPNGGNGNGNGEGSFAENFEKRIAAKKRGRPPEPWGWNESNEQFVGYIRRICGDPKRRWALREALAARDQIPAAAWWELGRWLPAEPARQLARAKIAAWIATWPSDAPHIDWRTPAGALAASRTLQSESSARTLLEQMTRSGTPMHTRCQTITGVLKQCPDPSRIDWAVLLADLERLDRGGQTAQKVRARWYREYHQTLTPPRRPAADAEQDDTDNTGAEDGAAQQKGTAQ